MPPRQRVVDDTTIAIGSGSTALAFAREIADRRLTVITNALDVANVLLDRDGIELIVLGGVVRPRMHSMLGHLAELSSQELRADTLFMGIGAISLEQGLMNDSVPEILTDRALRRMSRSVVVLADASKFEQVAPGYVFGLDEVDAVITDDAIPAATIDAPPATGHPWSRWLDDRGHRPARDPRGSGGDPRDARGADRRPGHRDALDGGRDPPDPRHRQRHQLPLEPGGGRPVPAPRRA